MVRNLRSGDGLVESRMTDGGYGGANCRDEPVQSHMSALGL